jgi:hypothetical protein
MFDRQALKTQVRSHERNETYFAWVNERKDRLKKSVSAHDVLRRYGVTLRYQGSDNEEQIPCPFHGKDLNPSARVYPEDARSASHLWCWTCGERWDIFGLWKKFTGQDDIKFTQLLFELERAFGLETPEGPTNNWSAKPSGPTEEEQETMELLRICERRLREAKPVFAMEGFLRVGQLLDTLWFEALNKLRSLEDIQARSRMILDTIGKKIRSA